MTHANDIRLTINTSGKIAASTAVIVEMKQAVKQYPPIPGTAEDDGWEHYMPGELSWSLSCDALYTDISVWVRELAAMPSQTFDVSVGDGRHSLFGTALLSEVVIQGEPRKLAKFTAKFSTNDFPQFH